MSKYPELNRLKNHFTDHRIEIKVLGISDNSHTRWVELSVNDRSWKLFVDDEYGDLKPEKPVVSLFLILSSLQEYQDSTDFIEWCCVSDLALSDAWLSYYRSMALTVIEIENELGSIDPVVSQYDYSMKTGLGRALKAI